MSDIAERSLHTRTARSVEAIRRSFVDNLFYVTGRTFDNATTLDHYTALAYTIRDRLLSRFVASAQNYERRNTKTVAYMSAEYLLGPHLGNNILNLEIWGNVHQAMEELGLDLEIILDAEEDPGLGNGGLGRLAACYMDSLATLEIPAIGYGIRYEYGIFEQSIKDGWQVEVADAWLRNGNPWELPGQQRYPVKFGGRIERHHDHEGRLRIHWIPESMIYGIAYDTPILGYGVLHVNLLRLWKSEARESFDLRAFNNGDYYGAVEDMVAAQNISKVLYPNDEPETGKDLRLRQQYFFVSCSLQDMIRLTLRDKGSLDHFPDRFVVQLNDTHPSIAIAEFMRLLIDEHQMDFDLAWALTQRSFAYTNHTLLPEALETWPLDLFQRILPRHLEIIYDINGRFLDDVRVRFIDDAARLARMSLIDEGSGDGVRRVRMANLACVGSMAINGVAEVHSELLKHTLLRDFHDMWPEKFQNKTNGVTPRRFIALANPPLAALIEEIIDGDWLRNLERLRQLEPLADNSDFRSRWRGIKRLAKERLADHIHRCCDITLDPDSLFDIQVKRIHEYKRQHLNVMHIVSLYHRLKQSPSLDITPRTFIFGGKAAPGYHMAKLIIKLINSVADVINRDPQVNKILKVVFVPNFSVKTGQRIYPAADISEQISTAGKEASGTGNMKLTMNGALTIGTLDGANAEIRAAVGEENFFLFGKTVQQVEDIWVAGYHPRDVYHQNENLRDVIDLINSGLFSHGDGGLFRPLTDDLLNSDPFLVCADFQDYIDCQAEVSQAYQDQEQWSRMSILNVARCGRFSSDRAIREYNADIWRATSLPVEMSKA
ncbi:glycogen/starch/alpha-glucan phosphorylase, partial [Sulfuricella sp. T08]|uniref:glycogen/starch/alpha-glucan phosphorylase n=1 Tax=Sulfuricella sp. T08 TaxID=1632857 RepID=UPI000750F173